MGKKVIMEKNVEIIYKIEDGRTSIVDGKISSRSKDSFFVRAFKRVIFSLDRKRYDLSEVTSSTIKILRKNIEKINPLNCNFNLATEGTDDSEY